MSAPEQLDLPARDDWFVRAAGAVGDLSNPFYREERHRDVWNEASAVGFQLVLWLGVAAATAMVWIGGETALPYAVAVLAVVGLPALASVVYAERLGVRVDDPARMLRLRLVPYVVLLVLFAVGTARVAPADGFASGFARGAAIGGLLAVGWLVVSGLRARRRTG